MMQTIKPKHALSGSSSVPGDKSISHRAVMLGAISSGITEISGFLTGEDCLSTISCFQAMGIDIQINGSHVTVHGKGLHGLTAPNKVLYVGNSGTTLRLMTGLLAAQPFSCQVTGDASIQKRPMDRVVRPLAQMEAQIKGCGDKICAPLTIQGKPLTGITYTLPVASAQVKSAILLAGLYAKGVTTIIEPEPTRDHTEIMLNYLGANIETNGNTIICHPIEQLYGRNITVPGDISSAAYFIAAGLLCKNSSLTVLNVGVNKTRTGLLSVLKEMGGNITLSQERLINGEPVCDIHVSTSQLHGVTVGGKTIPTLIDEIPILAVAACFAEGTTVIKNAEELKVKESNRIKTVVTELKKLGADAVETDDGMVIHGGKPLHGADCFSYQDHRIAMSLAIAGLCSQEEIHIQDAECVDISFPGFYDSIAKL